MVHLDLVGVLAVDELTEARIVLEPGDDALLEGLPVFFAVRASDGK